jgi:hypothetical protein
LKQVTDQPTEEDADDALSLLQSFLKHALDRTARGVPDIEDVKLAVAALILWHGFDEKDYEINNLIKQFDSGKGLSYVSLIKWLSPFAEHAYRLRTAEQSHKTSVQVINEDIF